jgi:hypothetical protein
MNKRPANHRPVDQNSVLVDLAVRNLGNITAFSALPDAPVQPYVERRRRLASLARHVADLRHPIERRQRRTVAVPNRPAHS